jgi:hypothetical protein
VKQLTVCKCNAAYACRHDLCAAHWSLDAPLPLAPAASGANDPLQRWGVFLCVRRLVFIIDPDLRKGEHVAARRQWRVVRLQHALNHCPPLQQRALASVQLLSTYSPCYECRRRQQRAMLTLAAAAALAANGVNCVDCAELSEDVVGVLVRHTGNVQALSADLHLPATNMQRIFDASQRRLTALSCLSICIWLA